MFLQNVPGATFIPGATSIPESKVAVNIEMRKFKILNPLCIGNQTITLCQEMAKSKPTIGLN